MTARRAIAAASALAIAAPAAAEPFVDADLRVTVAFGDGWRRDGVARRWRQSATGQAAAIVRLDVDGAAARRDPRRAFARVVAGARATAPGYRELRRRIGREGRIPRLDLWYRYDAPGGDRPVVALRVLWFRRYAVVLVVDTPAARFRAQRRAVRALLRSFRPWWPN
ncbi:MAG: hypothetical protein D6689_12640 [Deltaproteobacteria bacterium]|nr:MAG: hypothetical protein D6689_12640 [Deltaproteobacteria bacterium]